MEILNDTEKTWGVSGLKTVRSVMQVSNDTYSIPSKCKPNMSLPKVDERMSAFQSYIQMEEAEYISTALQENVTVSLFLQQPAMKYII